MDDRPSVVDDATDEKRRLAALDAYDILDTPAEAGFDDIVQLASQVCVTPVALVSFVAADRQWFKARVGFTSCETPLEQSVCSHALRQHDLLVISDLTLDSRTRDNPLVRDEPHLRFYAGAPIVTPDGDILGAVCVVDDKSRPEGLTPHQESTLRILARQVMTQLELRRLLRRRREEDQLHRQILDSAVDYAIVTMDREGLVTSWSEGARQILGWTEEEIRGRPARLFFTVADDAEGVPEREMKAAREMGRGTDERWHRRKDGRLFWANGEMMPLHADDGRHIGYLKILRDRTIERRREQRLLALAQASAGLLVASDPDEVLGAVLEDSSQLLGFDESRSYVVTPDGAHLSLTRSIGIGAEPRQASERVPFDAVIGGIVAEERRPLILSDVDQTTEPRYQSGRDSGLKAYAGFPVIVEDRLYGVLSFGSVSRPRFDPETLAFFGTLVRYLAVVRERLDKQAALLGLAETLEQRVDERTEELRHTEEKLRQSQKMEAVGQLTGGIAHDFNNLLTGITGALDLIARRIAQGRMADVERYIKTATASANRAAALTHRLLAFSRRQPLDPKPTDCDQLVASMEDLLRRTLGETVILDVTLSGADWLTLCDKHQLENALLNLVINARDAMPEGGRLLVSTSCASLDEAYCQSRNLAPGAYVCVSVADNGCGMADDVLTRAFDPFFTTKPMGQGTGLGLSMVYGFTRQSEGHVRIESAVGEGTTVSIYLPRFSGEMVEEAESAGTILPYAATTGGTVLIVEDEQSVRDFVTEVLGDLGYRTLQASDGPNGLRILQSAERIDLLITDVGLPGMNGRQLADQGRQSRPALKVLFITGYAENATFGSGFLDPATQMMTKPFAVDALAIRIRSMLQS